MSVRYYEALVAVAMLVWLLVWGTSGCEYGETTAGRVATVAAGATEPLAVDCADGKAHAVFTGVSREELAEVHVLGHLVGQPADHLHKQVLAYVADGEMWVDCAGAGVDYVTFMPPSGQ